MPASSEQEVKKGAGGKTSRPRPSGFHPHPVLDSDDQSNRSRRAGQSCRLVHPPLGSNRLGFFSLLFLSAWCGLVAGLLEVGTIVVRKHVFESDHLYRMSRHFVWLIPLFEPLCFRDAGIVWLGRHPGLAQPRSLALCAAWALLPFYPSSWLPFRGSTVWPGCRALGLAALFIPLIGAEAEVSDDLSCEFPGGRCGRGEPGGMAPGRRLDQRSASARPLPPPGSPNVLLIVMDTVAAGHLSLHGYDRATSTTLIELAEHGIRFDSARTASSWTLPSHATMFTGRWPYELSAGWFAPLDRTHPTLAEFLGDRGYATAGFVGNTWYCAVDSGLARGFTIYRDYIFPGLTAFKMAVLGRRAMERCNAIVESEDWLKSVGLLGCAQRLWRSLYIDRKHGCGQSRAP